MITFERVSVSMTVRDCTWRQDGTNFARLRVSANGVTRYIKTQIIVQRCEVAPDGRIKVPELRHRLEDYLRKVEIKVAKLSDEVVKDMTVDDVVAYIQRDDRFKLDFIEYYQQAIKDKKLHSQKAYSSALNAFISFLGKDSIQISEIKSSLLYKWEQWLKKKYGERARSVSAYPACLACIHAQARKEFNNDETGQVSIRNPFQYYHPPRQHAAECGHRNLTIDLVQTMIDLRLELVGRERFGVDLFLISFALMGMNCPDLYSCEKPADAIIHYYRTKTRDRREDKAEMMVRMEPVVQELFSEYLSKDENSPLLFDFSTRYTTYEIMGANANKGLKRFSERVHFSKRITLYWARHSWASIANQVGISKYAISDCLGHKNREMRVSDIYICKDWEQLWETNREVLEHFRW